MFRSLGLVVWIALTATGAHAEVDPLNPGDSLSIEECAAIARQRAPDVLISTLAWRAASADSLAAQRNRRPAFSLFGHVTVAPRGFYDPTITNLGEYMLKAGVDLPLLDGGDRAIARSRALDRAFLASIDIDRARRDAGFHAASLAIDILRLREQRASQASAFDWLDRLTSLLQAGAHAGSRTMADALRVSLERDAMQITLETTRSDLSTAARELAQLLGLGSRPAPGIREPRGDEDVPPSAADSTSLLATADRAPEVRAAAVTEHDQRTALTEAQRKNALRVTASADAGIAGADLTTAVPPDLKSENPDARLSDRLRRDLGASATLDFHMPVADPQVGLTVQARRHDLEAARLRAANELETQRRTLRDVLSRWEAAARKLETAEHSAARAGDHVLKMRSLYNAGSATLLELLDARHVLNDAIDRLALARAENRAARFEAESRR